MLDRVDKHLLQAVELVAKAVNYATGMDCLEMARIMNFVACALLFSIALLPPSATSSTDLLIGIIFLILLSFYVHHRSKKDIEFCEKIKRKEQIEGVKNMKVYQALKRIRLLGLLVIATLTILVLFMPGQLWIVGLIGCRCALYVLYALLSIDEPPYSRSQIKSAIKKMLRKPEHSYSGAGV